MKHASRSSPTPGVHLRIGRIVVDESVIGPGREGRRAFEAELIAAIRQRLAGSQAPAARASDRVADAIATLVQPKLDATRPASKGTAS
jgi:hypothetical protein